MRSPWLVGGAGVVAILAAVATAAPPTGSGVAVVTADHWLVTEAGAAVLAAGGNAADAAVAAALSAGVVQPAGAGLGGGGFALGRGPDGSTWVLDFRETAPAAATRDLFLGPDGKVVPDASTTGGLAVAVPSESRGLAEVVQRFGQLSLRQVAAPAIRLAENGFEVGPHLAGAIEATEHPAIRTWFTVDGHLATKGDRITNRPLGKTLRRWVKSEGNDLQDGAGAEAIVAAARESGGVLTREDLAGVDPKDRTPLVGTFRGRTIVTMPPPSSGGVVLLQLLAVLEPIDLAALGHNSADYVHLLAEAFQHAFADRAHHLGDPDFVDVPVARLLSADRADEIRRDLSPDATWPPEHYGTMVATVADHGTQHISVLDAAGGAVALTSTINTSFGSGLLPGSLGLVLNDQMDDFASAPGVPNAFGLIHDESNAIAPHKRPLSSMSPTVVSGSDGNVELVVGASGGSQIITGTLQVLLDVLVFGMDPQEAVAAPRFHHQWIPDVLLVEPGFPPEVVAALEARGHVVQVRKAFSSVQAVAVGAAGPKGGCDPRRDGIPATVP